MPVAANSLITLYGFKRSQISQKLISRSAQAFCYEDQPKHGKIYSKKAPEKN